MKKRELKKHAAAKDTNYYLMRLGLLEKRKLDHRELTADNLPDKLHGDRLTGAWFTVEDREVPAAEDHDTASSTRPSMPSSRVSRSRS